ncbi:starvation-inducible DNA-binding protein [Kordia periserrulae]|uniref:Starvation-inducible DNA-binding protein n=1 Tax=Kordia periserrulae TaxID=701523 RepID=A0A2T6C147_9FLAO|nr:Dps family protein [Kordia periserrulae]PTX62029.1 starvation-inducible DNA-binding protein [Kordia periserrulae]
MTLTILGLDIQKTEKLAKDLNVLLANFQVYYQNLRGIHWNIKGKGFFELHAKFEELYNDAQVKVDEVAERILTLGGEPLHTFEDYIANAKVPVGKHISKDEKAVELIVASISELLQLERSLLEKAADASDEGTVAMMSDFISQQEKTIWMMRAWLG